MSSNIPPLPPKPPHPPSGPDDAQGSSIPKRVNDATAPIFNDSNKKRPPAVAIRVDPALQALRPNDPLWPAIRLVQKDGLKLATLSEELRSNPIVVKEAVKNNGLALKFAGALLSENADIVLAAIHNNPEAIVYASIKLLKKNDMDLISFIQALGYTSNRIGICCGLGLMAIQALLCDDFATYESRLNKITVLIQKYKQMSDKGNFLELVKKDALSIQKDSDLVAFFDGIEICQKARDYPHLFEDPLCEAIHTNFLNSVIPLIGPVQLKEKGGVDMLEHFVRIYDTKELALHLKQLEPLGQAGIPCAIGLNGRDHALVIAYDMQDSSWVLIEHGRIYRLLNEDALAQRIHHSLIPGFNPRRKADLCAITTSICTTKDQSASLQKVLDRDCSGLLNIPALSDEKKQFAGDLLFLLEVIHNDDLAMFKAALEQGAVFDTTLPPNFWNMLMAVLQNANPAFPTFIIEKLGRSLIDKQDGAGNTFLLAATEANNIPLVQLLLKAGANLNQKNSDGETPLEIALDNNFLELGKLLGPRSKL